MKRLIVVSVVVLVAAFTYRSFGSAETATGSLTLEQPAPAPGDRAPEFTTRTAEGERFTLTDEGVYVLSFWSTLNESSNKAKPGFAELAHEYSNDEASFAAVYINQPIKLDYLWAGLCILGAVYFMFRGYRAA